MLWRVSLDPVGTRFSAAERPRRFSPLRDGSGAIIPSWYGATSREAALYESVFHDIRPSHRVRRIFPNQYLDRVLAPVQTARPLTLVDLTTTGLHAIGISRSALIDSTPHRYGFTQDVARRLVLAAPDADGFVWAARGYDTAQAVVLYAAAARSPMIEPHPSLTPLLLGIGSGLQLLRELATAARITVVVPDAR